MKTEKTEKKTPEETPIHNLFSREVRPIRDWNEWLERWQSATMLEEMLGLLHAGFAVSIGYAEYGKIKYDWIDRVLFYLRIADGWADSCLLEQPTDRRDVVYEFGRDEAGNVARKSQSRTRQVVATKAFDMVCLNFFRPENHEELKDKWGDTNVNFPDYWTEKIANERLLPVIVNFFRLEESKYGNNLCVRNLSRGRDKSPNEKHAVAFLLTLAEFLWSWKEEPVSAWGKPEKEAEKEKQNSLMQSRISEARPWMIDVLSELGELKTVHKWLGALDKPCIVKLREIAMRNKLVRHKHPVNTDRPVATLDEACYAGSQAAWLLKRHELEIREHKRLTAIRDAEQVKADADLKLKKLTKNQS